MRKKASRPMATLTLHNLRPWAESFELTAACVTETLPGVTVNTSKSVVSPDGTAGVVWEVKVHPPTVTVPARSKLSGLPLAAKDAPSVKAAVAAGALRISEDGNAAPLKRSDKGA